MRYSNQGRFRSEVRFFQQQFLQDGNLPFSDVLSSELIEQLLTALQVGWIDCIYTPLVTLRVFRGPGSERRPLLPRGRGTLDRVSRCPEKNARALRKRAPYCQARKRLPEALFSQIARQVGRRIDADVESDWLWKKRRVYIFDGATVSMPDTRANQQAYPQPPQQKTRSRVSVDAHRGHLFAGLRRGCSTWAYAVMLAKDKAN